MLSVPQHTSLDWEPLNDSVLDTLFEQDDMLEAEDDKIEELFNLCCASFDDFHSPPPPTPVHQLSTVTTPPSTPNPPVHLPKHKVTSASIRDVIAEAHRNNMHGNYKHACALCGIRFKRKEHLVNHVVAKHLKTRPYKCMTCEKNFPTKSALHVHERTHTQPRMFVCSWPGCNMGFNQKMHMYRHRQCVHLKTKPHACPECNKRFGQKSSMQRHLKLIHKTTHKKRRKHKHRRLGTALKLAGA